MIKAMETRAILFIQQLEEMELKLLITSNYLVRLVGEKQYMMQIIA